MSSSSSPHIPLKKALTAILLSVVIISGSSFLILTYYNHLKENRRSDPNNQIVAVVQTSPDNEGLKTVYLAELLELSIDSPTNLYAFNAKEALKKLLASPVIKEAKITKISPGTIWIDYSLRKPVAILSDYSNTMIDREGVPFPVKPFFTPKRLPEIFLGRLDEEGVEEGKTEEGKTEQGLTWGTAIKGKRLRLAFALLDFFNQYCCDTMSRLERIDVSKAYTLSYGQRQIVLILEDSCEKETNGKPTLCIYPRILRLDTDNYEQQLHRYLTLRSHLFKKEIPSFNLNDQQEAIVQAKTIVIDLRIPDLAFISTLDKL